MGFFGGFRVLWGSAFWVFGGFSGLWGSLFELFGGFHVLWASTILSFLAEIDGFDDVLK